jgi:chemotaxis protein MotA
MDTRKAIGVLGCVFLIAIGFMLQGNIGLYFNLAALLVVIGGTFAATLISFRARQLAIVMQVLRGSYRSRLKEPDEIVRILIDLSVKSRIKGLLSLQEDEKETSILFLRRALGFLVDGYSPEEIKDILSTEMVFFNLRRQESENVLRTMAEICPSFGLAGSVVGLIGMLSGIGDTSVVIAMIPIALTSTLYGVIFSNLFLVPFAANLRERTSHELLLQKIIMEGVLAIQREINPRVLEVKLKSFLTPSSRNVKLVSLERIREKFNIMPEGRPLPGTTKREPALSTT